MTNMSCSIYKMSSAYSTSRTPRPGPSCLLNLKVSEGPTGLTKGPFNGNRSPDCRCHVKMLEHALICCCTCLSVRRVLISTMPLVEPVLQLQVSNSIAVFGTPS